MPYEYIQQNHQKILDAFRAKSVEEICEKIRRHYMIVPETLFQELQKKRQSEASLTGKKGEKKMLKFIWKTTSVRNSYITF